MTIERKVGMGIAGQPTGGAVNVADVFSTYLYTGTGSNGPQTIINGIDLDGEGGMVWIKGRNSTYTHNIHDTERSIDARLDSATTGADVIDAGELTAFNSDGFTVGTGTKANPVGADLVSWTFRKAPKFFDVVTYTGNGGTNKLVPHNLGVAAGMVIIKRTDASGDWVVCHHSIGFQKPLFLNKTDAALAFDQSYVLLTNSTTLYARANTNVSGATYVAYLFADNTAEDADEQMIKCGSYAGNGSETAGPIIDLGWEPQYVMVKNSTDTADWFIYDSMRGWTADAKCAKLNPNLSGAETTSANQIRLQSQGFQPQSISDDLNGSTNTYIYMAIRAPMMVEPESGTEVFNIDTRNGTTGVSYISGFPTDFVINKPVNEGGSPYVMSRLTGTSVLESGSTAAEWAWTANVWDYQNGWANSTSGTSSTDYAWMFKRAKGFFDVVAYTGTGSARTVNHSLGVAPQLMIIKDRGNTSQWRVYSSSEGATKYLLLPATNASAVYSDIWNNTDPTDSAFTVGTYNQVNGSGYNFIAYLFGSVTGVSKVGSYTGNGSSQTIDCGFSAGARFILIRHTDSTGDWYIWDTTRGIVAGNDPHLSLNTSSAQVTTDDSVDPDNSGFIVNQVSATNINVSSGTYIYLAIA